MRGSLRVFVHEFRRLRKRERVLKRGAVLLSAAFAEEHVVADGAGEEHGLLRDIAEPVIQRVEGVIPDVDAVHKDLALRRVVEARDQTDQRGLAAAGRADDGQRLAVLHAEADMAQLVCRRMRIAEGDIPEFNGPAGAALPDGAFADGGAAVEHLVDTLRRDLRLRHEHEDHDQHHEGHDDRGRVGAENEHVREHAEPCGGVCQRDGLDQRRADPVYRQRQPVHP